MNKYQMLIICGKSGAGKDFIARNLLENYPQYFHKVITCTTRPKREGEENHKDYHFLTEQEFLQKVYEYEILEASQFNTWWYGTPIESLVKNKINLCILNLEGIENIQTDPRIETFVLKIEANDRMRLMRALNRENNPNCKEICRRFLADEEDWKEYEIKIDAYFQNNNNDKIVSLLDEIVFNNISAYKKLQKMINALDKND